MQNNTINFFINFLEKLKHNRVHMVSLRYKKIHKDVAFSGDYDFIVSENSVDMILKTLFELAQNSSINFVINRAKFGKIKISIYNQTGTKSIDLELWTHLEVKDDNTLSYIFYEDISSHIIIEKDYSCSLPLEIEALYYLSHLKTKNKDLSKDEIQMRLKHYRDSLKNNYPQLFQYYTAVIDDISSIKKYASKANSLLVEKEILFTRKDKMKLKQERIRRFKISKHRIYSQYLRAFKIIPVVGPDGVGKTTVIESIKEHSYSKVSSYRFKNLFRHNIIYQISRYFLQNNLPKETPKNQYDDFYGELIIYIALIYFPFLAFRNLLSSKFLFTDRFFHDFIIKDTRFLDKEALLRENWKALLKKVPNSFWFLHLDAPTKTILKRKQEMNQEAIDTYRYNIFTMYLQKPSIIYSYINTSLPLQNSTHVLMETAKTIKIKKK